MLKLQHCGSTKRNLQKLLFLQCLQCLFFFFCWSKQELVTPHLSCTWSCLAKVQFISIFPPANSTAVCLCALKNLPALSLGYLFFFFSISRFFWEINYVNTTLMKDFPKTFVQGLANTRIHAGCHTEKAWRWLKPVSKVRRFLLKGNKLGHFCLLFSAWTHLMMVALFLTSCRFIRALN